MQGSRGMFRGDGRLVRGAAGGSGRQTVGGGSGRGFRGLGQASGLNEQFCTFVHAWTLLLETGPEVFSILVFLHVLGRSGLHH